MTFTKIAPKVECIMFASQDPKNNVIVAYYYKVPCIYTGGGNSFKQYFVPSEDLSFSRYYVNCADRLTHTLAPKHRASSAVTKVFLPKPLVDEIKTALKQTPGDYMRITEHPFTKTEQFQQLFADPIPKRPVPIDENVFVLKRPPMGFFEKIAQKGNNPIQKALVSYIIDGTLPDLVGINDILIKISNLDPTEQQSILECIRIRLQTNDKHLVKLKNKATKTIDEAVNVLCMGTSGIIGLNILAIADDPRAVLIMGLILLLASYGIVAKYSYDRHHQLDNLFSEREKRLDEVITHLEDSLNTTSMPGM